MPYNFVAEAFTQRIFVADFLQAKCDFTAKTAGFTFLSHSLEVLGATYRSFFRSVTIYAFNRQMDRQNSNC